MIKFISASWNQGSPIGLDQAYEQVHVKGNRSLANQMEKVLEGKCCADHPHFHNEIEVDLSHGHDFMRVSTFCCENFKEKLELIADNQNPFE